MVGSTQSLNHSDNISAFFKLWFLAIFKVRTVLFPGLDLKTFVQSLWAAGKK